jgi:hypothetical protein
MKKILENIKAFFKTLTFKKIKDESKELVVRSINDISENLIVAAKGVYALLKLARDIILLSGFSYIVYKILTLLYTVILLIIQ